MKYVPELRDSEIKDNFKECRGKQELYKSKGLDFFKNRDFIFNKSGKLHGNILEIGSGRGVTALSLARGGYNFTTLDKDEEMLKITALNLAHEDLLCKAELLIMDGETLAIEDASFNNVLMIEVLHHIHDINGVFEEVDRVLCQKGMFILADFNDKGRNIIEDVHGSEGRRHESSSLGENEAIRWLSNKGYICREYDDVCHWVVIARKGVNNG